MNHLKNFNIFESNEYDTIKDIVSELEDYDFREIPNDYDSVGLKEYVIYKEDDYKRKYGGSSIYSGFISLIRIRVVDHDNDSKFIKNSEILLIKNISLRLESVGVSVDVFTYARGIENRKLKPGEDIPKAGIVDILCR